MRLSPKTVIFQEKKCFYITMEFVKKGRKIG